MDETDSRRIAKKLSLWSWLLFGFVFLCTASLGAARLLYGGSGEGSFSYQANDLTFFEDGTASLQSPYAKNKIDPIDGGNGYYVSLWDEQGSDYFIQNAPFFPGDVPNTKENLIGSYLYGVSLPGVSQESGTLCVYPDSLDLRYVFMNGTVLEQSYPYVQVRGSLLAYAEPPFSLSFGEDGMIQGEFPDDGSGKKFSIAIQGTPGQIQGEYSVIQGENQISLRITNSSVYASLNNRLTPFMGVVSEESFLVNAGLLAVLLVIQLSTVAMKKGYKIRIKSLAEGWIGFVLSLALAALTGAMVAMESGMIVSAFEAKMLLAFLPPFLQLGFSLAALILICVKGKPIAKARKIQVAEDRQQKAERKKIEDARRTEEKKVKEEADRLEKEQLAKEKEERLLSERKEKEEKAKLEQERRAQAQEEKRLAQQKRQLALEKASEAKAVEKAEHQKEKEEAAKKKFHLRPLCFLAPLLLTLLSLFFFLDAGLKGDYAALPYFLCLGLAIAMVVMAILGAVRFEKKGRDYFVFGILFLVFSLSAFLIDVLDLDSDSGPLGQNGLPFLLFALGVEAGLLIAFILVHLLCKKKKARLIAEIVLHGAGYWILVSIVSLVRASDGPSFLLRSALGLLLAGTLFFVFYSLYRPFSENEIEAKKGREQRRLEAQEEKRVEKEFAAMSKEYNLAIKNKDFEKAKELEPKIKQYEQENGIQKSSHFDGGLLSMLGWRILGFLLTAVTFGIAYPWAVCFMKRWEVNHTVIDGKRLHFNGKGGQLFGKYILWWLLCFVTFGIFLLFLPVKMEKWVDSHTFDASAEEIEHMEELERRAKDASNGHDTAQVEKLSHELDEYQTAHGILGKSAFDGKTIQYIGWNLLCGLLSLVSLGIGVPFSVCLKAKWKAKHQLVLGKRLAFDGNGLQLIGRYLLWLLLSIVTFGIFAWWLVIKMKKWKVKHTHFEASPETK